MLHILAEILVECTNNAVKCDLSEQFHTSKQDAQLEGVDN